MYKKSFLIFLLLLGSSFAFAQDSLLTIQQAVKSAYTRNAELQQMWAQLKQKQDIWRTEMGISAPEFSYFKEGIGSGPGDVFDEKRFTVSQEIDFPLTTSYRLKGIKEEVKALEYRILSREKEIKAEVKSQYVEVLYALFLQKSRQHQLKLAQNLYNAVYTRFETGEGNGIDLINAELKLDEAKNDLDQSEWILHQARYGLFFAMGLPVQEQKYSIQFSDTLTAENIEISQIFALAVQENQPDYVASEHEFNASEYFLKEARSNILPDIRFNYYKQNLGSGYDFNGFEVGLKIPIWYPFEQKGKINMAREKQQEIHWKQEEIKLSMKKQIEYAWHNYSVSRSIINRYNENMKEKASQLQELSLRAYQLGEMDLLQLLNAQQTYLTSEQRYLTALRDYYLQLVALEVFLEKDLVY
ncbi:TolC family protein [Prolixibacteraceae bacterium Z1-6]|uniref:TolC family protein n=1 Tax=Draconibacterium aestuarii TaxID=2998507 RepID=A0A9X3J531_9BACT|nr:TolC family protein [Prolixibacteraceae bacterium Z1-6]